MLGLGLPSGLWASPAFGAIARYHPQLLLSGAVGDVGDVASPEIPPNKSAQGAGCGDTKRSRGAARNGSGDMTRRGTFRTDLLNGS